MKKRMNYIKASLKQYRNHLNQREFCRNKLIEIQHSLEGVGSPNSDEPPAHSTQTIDSRKIALIDKKKPYEEELKEHELAIALDEYWLDNISKHKDIIKMYYVDGLTTRKIGLKIGYSHRMVEYKIDDSIKDLINRM